MSRPCPNCGFLNQEGHRFCSNCGAAISAPPIPAPVASTDAPGRVSDPAATTNFYTQDSALSQQSSAPPSPYASQNTQPVRYTGW